MADHCASFGGKRRACQYHYFKHTILQDNDGGFEEVTTTFLDTSRLTQEQSRIHLKLTSSLVDQTPNAFSLVLLSGVNPAAA
ncbi:MAG: hypothetical protein WKF77_28800 [Planctomycetaceae bacterium]